MPESAIRKYRIDDATYEAAGARAAAEGTDVSKLIRQWLGDYAANVDALAYRPQATPGSIIDELAALVEQLRTELDGKPRAKAAPAAAPSEPVKRARAAKATSSS